MMPGTANNLPVGVVHPQDNAPSDDLIKAVALDIGKGLVAYIEQMYPDVYQAMNSGARLSFRNHVYNDIMSALKCRTEEDYRTWMAMRKAHWRKMLRIYRNLRNKTVEREYKP